MESSNYYNVERLEASAAWQIHQQMLDHVEENFRVDMNPIEFCMASEVLNGIPFHLCFKYATGKDMWLNECDEIPADAFDGITEVFRGDITG